MKSMCQNACCKTQKKSITQDELRHMSGSPRHLFQNGKRAELSRHYLPATAGYLTSALKVD